MYHSQNKPSLKLKIHKIVSDTELMKCPTALEKVNTFKLLKRRSMLKRKL